jgi:tetratricopeptide (TPR) repeat protein
MPAVALLALAVLTGCATHEPATFTGRFIKQGEPKTRVETTGSAEEWRAAFREAGKALATAVPPPRESPPLLEERESDLAAALQQFRSKPTSEASRRVAQEYRRLGVMDTAHAYYSRAIELDRTDAASYDGRARIWRDWGMAQLGLGDSYRAVHYAPRSAAAHNTLGTLLAALGSWTSARAEFARALGLDPSALYAAANLCYVDNVEGRINPACPARKPVP